jgi:hypothetical protein
LQAWVHRWGGTDSSNCMLVLSNRRLVLWDKDDEKNSFVIPLNQLREATIEVSAFGSMTISLPDGNKYNFSLRHSWLHGSLQAFLLQFAKAQRPVAH